MKLTPKQFKIIQDALLLARYVYEGTVNNTELPLPSRRYAKERALELAALWVLNQNGQLFQVEEGGERE